MKAKHLTALATAAFTAGLSSCVLDTDPVPEMPYRPRPVLVQPTTPQDDPTPEPTTTWETAPEPSSHITESPAPKPISADAPQSATAIEAKPKPAATEPAPALPEPPAPAPTPAPAPVDTTPYTPAPAPAPAKDLQSITNTGPIPTAMPVEGDPTRVWNPLDPSKKIRIINPKTNQPYQSGKKLKVKGTQFFFYVP